MKTTWLLAVAIFRGNSFANFSGDATSRKSRWRSLGSLILFAVLAIYMAGVSSASAFALFDLLHPAGLEILLIGLYMSAGVMVVFIFGAMYVLSVFYYSSDVDKLLPLPLRPEQVIGAKFIVSAAYEYIFIAGILLPPMMVFGIRSAAPWFYYISLILVFALLPILPLALAAILTMLIMRFTPLARNKDRFNLFATLLLLGLVMTFSSTISSLSSRAAGNLVSILSSSAENISRITTSVFPGTSFAVAALASASPLSALVNIILLALLSGIALVVMLVAGRLLYFKGVIGLSAAANRRKALSSQAMGQQIGTAGHHYSAFWTYVLKDTRVLFRTPIFFVNNVLFNFLWPVFLLMPLISGGKGKELAPVLAMVTNVVSGTDQSTAPILLASVFGLALFVNGTNGIAESALSREGSQFYIMKILPMSYTRQIAAKLTVGMGMGLVGMILSFAFAFTYLKLPLWFVGLAVLTFPGTVLLPNLSGIIFELYWPKLHWDNEQKAVKQNMNVVFGIFAPLLVAGLLIAPIAYFKLNLTVAVIILTAGPLALSAALLLVLRRLVPVRMRAISP
jgi:ABC-2 type transport system permease protein